MILCLIQGTLGGEVAQRTSASGNAYWTGSVRTAMGEAAEFITFICFAEAAGARLMKLSKGQPLALAGELQAAVWRDKAGHERRGWKLLANDAMTLHQARKIRATAEVA